MISTHMPHTLPLPVGVVRATVEGKECGWELNLAAMSREVLYLPQETITQELQAQEGRTFHILTEQKEKLEQDTLYNEDLAALYREVEKAAMEACNMVLELAIPRDLPPATKIQHMATGFHTTQAEATRNQEELTS